jgi:hypothetical protein
MAAGALLAVDGSALAFYIAASSSSDDSEGLFFGGLFALIAGFGIMIGAYRAYRYGEHYEFRRGAKGGALRNLVDFDKNAEDAMKWLDRLN